MNDAPLKLRQSLKAQWPALIVLVCVGGLAVFAGPAGDVFEAGFAEQGVEVPDLTGGVHLVAGILASLVFFTMVVYPLLANRYSLTADQVQEVNGIIQRHTRTTRLEHVRAVNVEIGFVGRILGYGDVVFFTAGSGGDDVRLTGIDDPESVARRAEHFARQAASIGKMPSDIGIPASGTPETLQLMRKAQLQREELIKVVTSLVAEQRQNTDRLCDHLETLTLRVEALEGDSAQGQWQPRKHRSGEAAARRNHSAELHRHASPVSELPANATAASRPPTGEQAVDDHESTNRDNQKFFTDDSPITAEPEERIAPERKTPKSEGAAQVSRTVPLPKPPHPKEQEGVQPAENIPTLDAEYPTRGISEEISPQEKARRRALVEKTLSESDTKTRQRESEPEQQQIRNEISLLKPSKQKPSDLSD